MKSGILIGLVCILVVSFSACKSIGGVKYDPALAKEINENDAVIVLSPGGEIKLVDNKGKPAQPCIVPDEKKYKNKEYNESDMKKLCIGFQKGHYVTDLFTFSLLRTVPNPHGCWYCYTTGNSNTGAQICRPDGCELQGH